MSTASNEINYSFEKYSLNELLDSDTQDSLFKDCDYYDFDTLKEINFGTSSLNILHLNIRGMQSKISNLKVLLKEFKDAGHEIAIVTLCETFMCKKNINKCKIEGYCLKESAVRENMQRGGVAIYTRDNLNTIVREDIKTFKEGIFESCFIEILTNDKNKNIIIGEIYRVPKTNSKEFLTDYRNIINKIMEENKEFVLCTDQNLDYLKINNHRDTSDLLELNLNSSIIPTILRPTRVTHETATLIDNIYLSKKLSSDYVSGIVKYDISDHFPCFTMIKKGIKLDKIPLTIKSRKLNEKKINRIKGALDYVDWEQLEPLNTNDAYNKFDEVLFNILDTFAPEKISHIKAAKCIQEPWMTKGILYSSRRIQKMYSKCAHLNKSDPKLISYVKHRNLLNSLKRKAKFAHYKELIVSYKNNSKKLWQTINEITGKSKNKKTTVEYININGIQTYNKNDIANGFCNYFSNVGVNTSKKIDASNKHYSDYMGNQSEKTVFFYPTNIYEIEKIIHNLKNKHSFGDDGISNNLIKSLKSHILYPLEIIFNKSLSEGTIPEKFKIAHVTPIFKSNSKRELNNYRPISLLNCISKILERIVYNRMYRFLEKEKLFNKRQFGFRKSISTIDAITYFLSNLIPSLDKKEYNMAIFLDLTKAFDTIDHKILLYKLDKIGVRGITLIWMQNYLNNRKQKVRIYQNNSNNFILSEPQILTHGIPQGSILGPLLFNVYIHDLENSLTNCTPISFADDTTILVNDKSFEDLYIKAYENLISIIDYFNSNKLALNLTKTNYILFKSNNLKNSVLNRAPELIVNGIKINKVEHTKFLGVFIDEKLNWNYHVNNVINKIKQSLYIFKCSKHLLDTYSKLLLYYAHVISHCTYGTLLWAPMISTTQTRNITNCIYKIITCISNTKVKQRRTDNIYKQLNILKFNDITEFELCKFMYKLINKMAPEAIEVQLGGQPKVYNTRNRNIPTVCRHNSNLFNTSFLNKSNICFTRLPENIKKATNYKLFKKYFSEFKIQNY